MRNYNDVVEYCTITHLYYNNFEQSYVVGNAGVVSIKPLAHSSICAFLIKREDGMWTIIYSPDEIVLSK